VYDSNTDKTLDKYVWIDSLPKLESEAWRSDTPTEHVIRVTADIQPDGISISVDESTARTRNSIAKQPITTDNAWSSDSVRGMVPKPGSFDASLFVDPRTASLNSPITGTIKNTWLRFGTKQITEINSGTIWTDKRKVSMT
jgi:hypothetical protein